MRRDRFEDFNCLFWFSSYVAVCMDKGCPVGALHIDSTILAQVVKDLLHGIEIDRLKGTVSVKKQFVGVCGGGNVGLDHLVVVVQDEFSRWLCLKVHLHHRAAENVSNLIQERASSTHL